MSQGFELALGHCAVTVTLRQNMDFPRLATQYKLMQINGHVLALAQLFA